MALNDITFVKGAGGLGRGLIGEDHISGLIYYTGTLPSGFSSTDRIKLVYSVSDAEALGIVGTYAGETKATGGNILLTNAGVAGDICVIKVTAANLPIVTLATYTVTSADSSVSLLAASIRSAINAGTATHGFVASGSTGNVALACPKGYGANINSGSVLTNTITGTVANTITQFTSGANDPNIALYYQVKEYFRLQPKGVLYIGLYSVPSTFDGTEITTLQNFAQGKIRQVGVYYTAVAFATSQLTSLQSQAATLEINHKQLVVIYGGDTSGTAPSALPDLSALTASKVMVVIGQDISTTAKTGEVNGSIIYKYTGKSVPCVGAALGCVSTAKVSDSIAWVAKFPLDTTELDEIGFGNGSNYLTSAESLLSQLNTYRYTFVRKHVNLSGSFFNDSFTAIANTSDYGTIENNRTIDKAIRGIRTNLLPSLSSPLLLNSDGTLTADTVAYFTSLASKQLEGMQNSSEISQFQVTINPSQNVLATSTLTVAVKIVPVGVARSITVNIGFTTSI